MQEKQNGYAFRCGSFLQYFFPFGQAARGGCLLFQLCSIYTFLGICLGVFGKHQKTRRLKV